MTERKQNRLIILLEIEIKLIQLQKKKNQKTQSIVKHQLTTHNAEKNRANRSIEHEDSEEQKFK